MPEVRKYDPSKYVDVEYSQPEPEKTWVQEAIEATPDTLAALPEAASEFSMSIPVLGTIAKELGMGSAAVASYLTQQAGGKDKSLSDIYAEIEKMEAERAGKFQEENPVLATAAKFGGAMVMPGVGPAGNTVKAIATRALGEGAITAADVGLKQGADAALEEGSSAAKWTAGIGVVPKVARGVRDVVGWAGFGVKPGLTRSYKARQEAIKNADIEETGAKVADVVDTAKADAIEATHDLRAAKRAQADAKKDIEFRVREAEPSGDLVNTVIDGMKQKRVAISAKSSEAFDELAKSGQTVNLSKTKSQLTSYKKALELKGKPPKEGTAARIAYDKIDGYREYLDDLGKDIDATDAKTFLQIIDEDISEAYSRAASGGYVDKGDRALMSIRGMIDEELKRNKTYADIMAGLSHDTQLMKRLESTLGREDKVSNNLKKILSGNKQQEINDLTLIGRVADPEGFIGRLAEERRYLRSAKDPALKKELLEKLPETQMLRESEARASDAKDFFNRVKVPGDPQNWVKKMGYGNATKKQKELIDRINEAIPDTNLRQEIEDLGVQRAFDVGITRGSRNVNLNAISLAGLVGMFRPEDMGSAGPVAAMFGAAMGAVSDVMGPKIFQKWLDFEMYNDKKFGKYLPVIKEAMLRSPRSVGITHQTLMKTDENYRKLMGFDSDEPSRQSAVPMPQVTEGLLGAAERGDNGVNAEHYKRMQSDPEYRKKVTKQKK